MKITGYYNERGYQIESDNPMDAVMQRAGLSQLPLEMIKRFCEQIAKRIAERKNAEFVGVEYLESDEI